jgi:hypothetical protein
MKITFKRTYNEYVVTVNGRYYAFDTCKEACEFIFNIRKEVA